MIDPRTRSVIAAISDRYPETRISVVPSPDPDSIPIPDLLIVWEADFERLREVENYAIERTLAACAGEPIPHNCLALNPATAEEYLRGPPDVEALAAASRVAVRGA